MGAAAPTIHLAGFACVKIEIVAQKGTNGTDRKRKRIDATRRRRATRTGLPSVKRCLTRGRRLLFCHKIVPRCARPGLCRRSQSQHWTFSYAQRKKKTARNRHAGKCLAPVFSFFLENFLCETDFMNKKVAWQNKVCCFCTQFVHPHLTRSWVQTTPTQVTSGTEPVGLTLCQNIAGQSPSAICDPFHYLSLFFVSRRVSSTGSHRPNFLLMKERARASHTRRGYFRLPQWTVLPDWPRPGMLPKIGGMCETFSYVDTIPQWTVILPGFFPA